MHHDHLFNPNSPHTKKVCSAAIFYLEGLEGGYVSHLTDN